MLRKFIIPAAFAFAIATPALAATAGSSTSGSRTQDSGAQQSTQQENTTGQATTPMIAQKLRSSLSQAGFTDIHVMPQSFLVRAKDQDGNPVMMVINPNSLMAVTAANPSNGTAGSHTGATPGSSTSGSSINQKQ